MKGKTDGSGWSKAEKIGVLLTASIALGGMYGSVSDRISAVESNSASMETWKESTNEAICKQGKKIDAILENTNELRSDMKLLKATKADRKFAE